MGHAYSGDSWPGIMAFKRGPTADFWAGQELRDLGMCHHTWFRLLQDAHGYRMSKQASDKPLIEVRFLSDLFKRDLTAIGDHA